jgi:addiction module HigA family antidote
MPMKNPPHPGRIVQQECLEPLGLSVTDGAKALGVSRNALSELVNERRGISPEMAIRLDKAFGGGAETWHRIQASYDMAQAMKNASRIKVKRVPRQAA